MAAAADLWNRLTWGHRAALALALVSAVGTLGPWVVVDVRNASFEETYYGYEAEPGLLSFLCAVAAVLVLLLVRKRLAATVAAAVLLFLAAFLPTANVANAYRDPLAKAVLDNGWASFGWGVWVALTAGWLAFVGAMVGQWGRPASRPAPAN